MNDLKEFLEKYCEENGYQKPIVNMFIFGHNDMLNFASQYFEKKVSEYLEKEKSKLMGNS